MIDDWFSPIKLPLSLEQFRQLPRNPAYKYEYIGGQAWLSPRPHGYHAVLDLRTFVRPPGGIASHERIGIRPLQVADWSQLPELLAAAFHGVQPFASLTDDDRRKAAKDCLDHTKADGDGSLIGEACLIAARDDSLIGAILISIPPRPTINEMVGLPQIAWVFVNPWDVRHGIGTALLGVAVPALLRCGHARLASGFLVGNEASMLWHWQAGFRLPKQPWSLRTMWKETGDRTDNEARL